MKSTRSALYFATVLEALNSNLTAQLSLWPLELTKTTPTLEYISLEQPLMKMLQVGDLLVPLSPLF